MDRVKEQSCFVAMDPLRELKLGKETNTLEKMVCLYDHRYKVRLNEERFMAPEILFQVGVILRICCVVWSM